MVLPLLLPVPLLLLLLPPPPPLLLLPITFIFIRVLTLLITNFIVFIIFTAT
jgi:hypothetical protein